MSIKIELNYADDLFDIEDKVFKMGGAWFDGSTDYVSFDEIEDFFGVFIENEYGNIVLSYTENEETFDEEDATEMYADEFLDASENEIRSLL